MLAFAAEDGEAGLLALVESTLVRLRFGLRETRSRSDLT